MNTSYERHSRSSSNDRHPRKESRTSRTRGPSRGPDVAASTPPAEPARENPSQPRRFRGFWSRRASSVHHFGSITKTWGHFTLGGICCDWTKKQFFVLISSPLVTGAVHERTRKGTNQRRRSGSRANASTKLVSGLRRCTPASSAHFRSVMY